VTFAQHPLSSAHAKVSRAKVHIEALDSDIRVQTKSDITVARKNLEQGGVPTGDIVDVLNVAPHDPLPWGIMLGDIVSNLRAALDHIAWELAMLRCSESGTTLGNSQAQNVYFPLRDVAAHTPYRAGAGLFKSDVAFFPDRAWDTVEAFQPYNRASRGELELLAVLDELSRIDKHRSIVVPERLIQLQVSATDTKVIRQSLHEPHHQWLFSGPPTDGFEPDGKYDIVMYPPVMLGKQFSALQLSDIHDLIRNDVLPAFASFF
jgi:hypothetical protein